MASFVLPTKEEDRQRAQAYNKATGRETEEGERVYTAIPANEILDAEVVEVELRDKPEWAIFEPDQTQEVSFRFRVIGDSPYAKRNLWGRTPPFFNWSPRCRMRLWIQAILGVDELPEGYEVDFDALRGKRVRILVDTYVSKKTGETKDFIKDVFPLRNQGNASAAATRHTALDETELF